MRHARIALLIVTASLAVAARAGAEAPAQFVFPANGATNVDLTRFVELTAVPSAEGYKLYV
jgi:hypothetical protein